MADSLVSTAEGEPYRSKELLISNDCMFRFVEPRLVAPVAGWKTVKGVGRRAIYAQPSSPTVWVVGGGMCSRGALTGGGMRSWGGLN
jgi:hypothetical protein